MRELPVSRGLLALVDDEDYDELSRFTWSAHLIKKKEEGYYAQRGEQRRGMRRTIYMHRQILRCASGEMVDHINGNGLDNRRSNLRKATRQDNNVNRRYTSASGFRGVSKDKRKLRRSFLASIFVDGKHLTIGYFYEAKSAALAYDVAAREAFGEFAILNFP